MAFPSFLQIQSPAKILFSPDPQLLMYVPTPPPSQGILIQHAFLRICKI